MNRTTAKRIEVQPGSAGVHQLSTALREVLFSDGSPVALVPVASSGTQAHHVAAMSAAVEAKAPVPQQGVAVIMPTSGSTGEPRGVLLSREGLVAAGHLGAAALGPAGLWLTALPVTGIGGLLTVTRAVLAGGDPVVWPGVGGAASFTATSFGDVASETLRRAASDGVPAYVSLVPTQFARLLDHPDVLETLAGFKAVIVGGAAMACRAREIAESTGIRIVATYGATETGGGVVYNGVPLPGVDITLSDDGIISVGGPTLALGYRLRPDLDRARFVAGRFITSDLGRWVDGRLEVVGRTDSVIKVGGVKVSLTAINEALLCHIRVIDAVTVAEPDSEWGRVPRAYVIPDVLPTPGSSEYENLVSDLMNAVADRLGRAATPRQITLTRDLPQLASGKAGIQPGTPEESASYRGN
jgi:O-succinylbenzoic acid--CoA ligase